MNELHLALLAAVMAGATRHTKKKGARSFISDGEIREFHRSQVGKRPRRRDWRKQYAKATNEKARKAKVSAARDAGKDAKAARLARSKARKGALLR